jgi:hypothetical protein
VLAYARALALLACAPDALVLADARARAILACAPVALVLADARPPALRTVCPAVRAVRKRGLSTDTIQSCALVAGSCSRGGIKLFV